MTCHELALLIERTQPSIAPRDVARFCLLMANFVEDWDCLNDEAQFRDAWNEMGIRLQATTDQHAAMTAELDELCNLKPEAFSIEHVWVLIRAIRVQSQVLQLYVGEPQPAK